jgi:hypothetical protein
MFDNDSGYRPLQAGFLISSDNDNDYKPIVALSVGVS